LDRLESRRGGDANEHNEQLSAIAAKIEAAQAVINKLTRELGGMDCEALRDKFNELNASHAAITSELRALSTRNSELIGQAAVTSSSFEKRKNAVLNNRKTAEMQNKTAIREVEKRLAKIEASTCCPTCGA